MTHPYGHCESAEEWLRLEKCLISANLHWQKIRIELAVKRALRDFIKNG